MQNQIEKHNGNGNLFAVDQLYNKLVEPMQHLADEEYVDVTLRGIATLKQGIEHLYEKLFDEAEIKQEKVLEHRDTRIQTLYDGVEHARKNRDFEAYERALVDIGEVSLFARDAVNKLKYIQSRGFGEYNSKEKIAGMVRDLETKLLARPTGC